MKESTLQKKCLAYLKAQNIYTLNIYGSGRAAKGAPDIICCINGRFVAFELKVPGNTMQDDQKIHKMRIEKNGGLHFVPYSYNEFTEIVQQLKARWNDGKS